MLRLLATDIDDTLLARDGSLPPANRDALIRLHDAGVVIVFCSGRSDLSIRNVAAGILDPADDEYYIAFNGARVVTADTRTDVAHRYVSRPATARIAAYAREHGLHLQGYAGDEFVVERATPVADRYAADTGTRYRVVDDLPAALPEGSPKLLLIGEHETLVSHRDRLVSIGDTLSAEDGFATMFSKPHYLEIVAAGVHKGYALRRLAEILLIPMGETLAVGDGENDAEMIRAAGVGLAVASAHPAARNAADIVLASTADEGAIAEIEARFFA
jgi:Cof subfamily protein (haloacid dehalogenase superfamily)